MDETPKPLSREYASAAEAMKMLKVRRQTLYAYVSRGWIRSIPPPGRKDRLYRREDIQRVSMRSLARSGHGAVAASAMNWGEPILPTAITEITPLGPRYRGLLAADLVRSSMPFEAVAELLWTGHAPLDAPAWPVVKPAENHDALRGILILMADHEVPPGTFSARVVASAGGTLHSCLASAPCATNSGLPVHCRGHARSSWPLPRCRLILQVDSKFKLEPMQTSY